MACPILNQDVATTLLLLVLEFVTAGVQAQKVGGTNVGNHRKHFDDLITPSTSPRVSCVGVGFSLKARDSASSLPLLGQQIIRTAASSRTRAILDMVTHSHVLFKIACVYIVREGQLPAVMLSCYKISFRLF